MSEKQQSLEDIRTRYLLSFLMILIHRQGGKLTITKLSQFAGRNIFLNMELQKDRDRVILRTAEAPAKGGPE